MTYEQLIRRMALDKEKTDPLNIPEIEELVTEPEDILEPYFHLKEEIENG